jgi:serine/threonine-protein kinase
MEDLTGRHLGPYRILGCLGAGGMATVYKAFQPSLERTIALKVLDPAHSHGSGFSARFRHEAKIIAELAHPHIVPVYDYGEAEGYAYIVMRLVEGGTVAELLKGTPLPLRRINRILSQVASALDFAHEQGVVHRDIKPHNVLMDTRGNCLLTDFGIARLLEAETRLTEPGFFLGTPVYVSPEQALGEAVDRRSDVYSLGVMLFEMATGQPPYEADTPAAVMVKHVQGPIPAPRSINPALPVEVERVILKALARQPEDRFPTAGAFAKALAGPEGRHLQTVDEISRDLSDAGERKPEPEVFPIDPELADGRDEGESGPSMSGKPPDRRPSAPGSGQPPGPPYPPMVEPKPEPVPQPEASQGVFSRYRSSAWFWPAVGGILVLSLLAVALNVAMLYLVYLAGRPAGGVPEPGTRTATVSAFLPADASHPTPTEKPVAPAVPVRTNTPVPSVMSTITPTPQMDFVTSIESWPAPGSSPKGISWDGADLWLMDNQFLLKTGDGGTTAQMVKCPSSCAWGIGGGMTWVNGDLWVIGMGNVFRLEFGENGATSVGGSSDFTVHFDTGDKSLAWNGNAFLAGQNHTIYTLGMDGSYLDHVIYPLEIHGLAWIDGKLWVAGEETVDGRRHSTLDATDPFGRPLEHFSLPVNSVIGVSWDGEALWSLSCTIGSDVCGVTRMNIDPARTAAGIGAAQWAETTQLVDILQRDPPGSSVASGDGRITIVNDTGRVLTLSSSVYKYSQDIAPGATAELAAVPDTASVPDLPAIALHGGFELYWYDYIWTFRIYTAP